MFFLIVVCQESSYHKYLLASFFTAFLPQQDLLLCIAMKRITKLLFILVLAFTVTTIFAKVRFGHRLCSRPGYSCYKVKKGQSWKTLWPDPQVRRIVMRVNRRSLPLYQGMVVAVPNNLYEITHMDISPFPYFMHTGGERTIVLDMDQQAFGAYDANGYLLHWGPLSAGKGWCPDVNRRCVTPRGTFRIFRKGDEFCESTVFPIPDGGAPMFFCMYFYKGFAMHYGDLPGYHASHGCVRMFYEDAEWLNEKFVNTGARGTRVIVR